MLNHGLILRQEKNYAKLFAAGIVNGIGDRFSQVAVLGLLLYLTGSGLAVGITFAVRLLPFLLFGPLGGWLADRFSKKRIMIATDLARVIFALSPLLVREAEDVWIIYVNSFLLSAGEALYSPARMSAIPLLVGKEHLLKVNSLEEVLTGLVLIGGSLSGGLVSSLLGAETTFVLNSLSFFVSALLLRSFPSMKRGAIAEHRRTAAEESLPAPRPGRSNANRRTLPDWLIRSPFLLLMLAVFSVWPIGDGIFNTFLSVYAIEVFHRGDLGIGILYGALGAGLVIGSGMTGKFTRHMKAAAILTLFVEGVFHVLISQSGSFMLLVILLGGTAVCSGIGNACNQTLLMTIVPDRVRGRFMGMLATMQNTMMGIAMFLGGLTLKEVSPRALGLFGGLLLAAPEQELRSFTCCFAAGFMPKSRKASRITLHYNVEEAALPGSLQVIAIII